MVKWATNDDHQFIEALNVVERSYPSELKWKVQMYKGYLAICNPDEPRLSDVEQLVDSASSEVIQVNIFFFFIFFIFDLLLIFSNGNESQGSSHRFILLFFKPLNESLNCKKLLRFVELHLIFI